MKKALSLILSLIMAISTLTCFGTTAFALEYDAVLTGPTTFTRTIKSDEDSYFKFTPKRTGAYYFYYRDRFDLKCYIYDSEDKVEDADYLEYFDDNYNIGDYKRNFITNPFTFIAGTEYIFEIHSYADEDVTANFVLSRLAPSDYEFVMLDAIYFNIPEPQVGDAVEDFEFSTTTVPSGYGQTGEQYWETDDEYFQEGVTYEFDGDSWVDYDRCDWEYYTTKFYVNGKYIGTFGDFWPCFTICSHENTTTGVVPATCTADGYTDGTVCADCGKALANGTTVIPKSATIRKSATTFTYNGKVQRPLITVFDRNGTQLTYKKDFTVSYSNWNSTDPGTYYVYVHMVGNYNDVRAYTYTINSVSVTPKLNRNTITYNGTVQRPLVTVTDSKGNALEYKEDFVVDYSNWSSKNVGRYTVTVTMVGAYSGTYTYPYYINPKGTTFLTSAQGGFKGIKNGFTLKWNKQTNQTTGYQIQYATKSDFSNAATIYAGPSSATSKTITGRASKTRYYVRIRTYKNIGGKYFYSDWSTGTKSVVTL